MKLSPFRCKNCCTSFQGTLDLAGSSVCMKCRRDLEGGMPQFKVGDVVECMEGYGEWLTTGKQYTVLEVIPTKVGWSYPIVSTIGDNFEKGGHFSNRFKLVTSATPAPQAGATTQTWTLENGSTIKYNTTSEDPLRGVGGVKHDSDKPQFRLVNPDFLLQMVNVLTLGARKYPAWDNYKKVDPFRYEDALERHWNAWRRGEKDDPESKMSHLAHVAVNAMFLFFFDSKDSKSGPK